MSGVRAVLFDLDGTFADTAPDLTRALNRLRADHRLEPLPVEATRPQASAGARGLLQIGFGLTPEHGDYEAMRARFLEFYADALCAQTRPFDGVADLLARLEGRGIAWGIVTNKPRRFTDPLMRELGFAARAGCIVSGDTTPRIKPHPDSLLHAASLLGLEPSQCLYVGDDLRDVQAARAAGCPVIVAGWGYLGGNGDPRAWGADAVIAHPLDTLNFI